MPRLFALSAPRSVGITTATYPTYPMTPKKKNATTSFLAPEERTSRHGDATKSGCDGEGASRCVWAGEGENQSSERDCELAGGGAVGALGYGAEGAHEGGAGVAATPGVSSPRTWAGETEV